MAKNKKMLKNDDPFSDLLNPFENKANPKAKPRKRTPSAPRRRRDKLAILIKETRLNLGWTQRDLAERASVGLRQVGEMEKGNLKVAFQTLNRVLTVLGYELHPRPLGETDSNDD